MPRSKPANNKTQPHDGDVADFLGAGRLHNVDLEVLRELVDRSVRDMRRKYA